MRRIERRIDDDFTVFGSGVLGEAGRFDIVGTDPQGNLDEVPALTLVLSQNTRWGVRGFEASGVIGGTEVFWVRACPAPIRRAVRSASRTHLRWGPLGQVMDTALGLCAIESFFGRTTNYQREDVISALTFNMALGRHGDVTSVADVWLTHGKGTELASRRIARDLRDTFVEALERAPFADIQP